MNELVHHQGDEPLSSPTAVPLYNLVYCSCAAHGVDAAEVDRIVATARRRNPAEGITGVLVYGGGIFFQWLEGPRANVVDLMDGIKADPRHWNVVELSRTEEVRERMFPSWDMELVTTDDIRDVLRDAQGTARNTENAADLVLLMSRLDAGELGIPAGDPRPD